MREPRSEVDQMALTVEKMMTMGIRSRERGGREKEALGGYRIPILQCRFSGYRCVCGLFNSSE